MADGSQAKLPTTSAQVIKLLRENVEEKGGFDKMFILRGMMQQIQKEHPLTQENASTSAPSAAITLDARLLSFLDANGGYRDHAGGYYDPKAGTYADKEGGFVDNWSGYTYKDGSYKSKFGDFWDAPTHTYKLADGRVAQLKDLSNADAIKALRQNVEENGGYDKDLVIKSMITAINNEHPPGASKTH